ncbi:Mur ligase family protein [Nitratidesulfovibrio sp. SRB-5]|uniref:Mur ligase family protein n=1 Tax=Nitratidesulfovibrio sp. SRB-5 TaxID=2872636 RepID=UPI00102877B2|nr:UDP-N-acetylmuramoyl-tripeptide--D-alanyl-D-alanine ligase [Nitratidesulfovibrio sp. SRB-5]MBZ2172555.1 UDP-N-acetylmuramoyl-tripeptide--D-alanyl-D-alanine ligase [Nitratidesulfovibrio sp. SRB-5]RXF77093.1 UDP-N-acetylmuramoyl-tripeptide--D-alanyl-D-alanine ligase [Desulfovibrio sp. DS-1]
MASSLFLGAAFLAFAVRRGLTWLHIFQQEEYDGPRFLRWMAAARAFDKRATLPLLACWGAALAAPESAPYAKWAAGFVLLAVAAVEDNPLKAAKKKLVLTARVKRILSVALGLTAVYAVALALCPAAPAALLPFWILGVQALPLALVAANASLAPVEARIQQGFWNEAHEKLLRLAPTVIAVTGSYGKTSVKHILAHVLGCYHPTLMTPGSINTPMGISRIIRERLTDAHRFFIAEMGAYGIGSIERLCRLAPPDFAIITNVGPAHYERFKDLATVVRAKFELAHATVARGGRVVLPAALLAYDHARDFAAANAGAVLLCAGADVNADAGGAGVAEPSVRVLDAGQDLSGIHARLLYRGQEYEVRAPIHGMHHVDNVALAFAAACGVGVEPQRVVSALRSLPQIAHRLEVKPQPDGSVLIDDAYNSNPSGFASALDLLDLYRKSGQRGVLVTPGMVELGTLHDSAHAELGARAAACADVLLAVAPARIPTLVDAFRAAAGPDQLVVECADFAAARAWLAANIGPGDAVLLENDLPDLYEKKVRV